MRASPVIVLEMGTRHGHQVSRPSVQINQTGRSKTSGCPQFHPIRSNLTLSKQCQGIRLKEGIGNDMLTASLSGRRTLHPHPGL